MKILQFVTQHEPAGAQQHAIRMAQELNRRGHAVTTAFLYLKRQAYPSSPTVINLWPCPPNPLALVLILLKAWWLILSSKPNIVMTYTHWSNAVIAPIARLAGARYVIANQTQDPARGPKAARLINRFWTALGVHTRLVANSRSTYDALHNSAGSAARRRLTLILLGIDIDRPTLTDAQTRRKYHLPVDTPIALHVGRLAQEKNHKVLLHAIALCPQAHLVLIGDGELRTTLKTLADDLNVRHRVHWLGELPSNEISNLLYAADVFAFPSLHEGFGLAPIEAAHAGLPLIVSNIPVFNEILALPDAPPPTNNAALLVNPKNPQQWAEAIALVINSQETRTTLKDNAKAVAAHYTLARMTDDYQNLFLAVARFPKAPQQ